MENFQEELIKALGNLKNFVPVGTPWWGFDVKAKPIGVQLYQGQVLARDMYPVHWNYIQSYRTIVSESEWWAYADSHNGMCPYFSSGDEVGTYRMPKIVDVHPRFCYWGDDVGKYIEAGLPNITGALTNHGTVNFTENYGLHYTFDDNSAIYADGIVNNGFSHANNYASNLQNIKIDAHRSNNIYGQSDTVQPPAVNMLIGEYVVSGISEFDIVTANEIIKGIDALQTDVGKVVKEDRLEKYNTAYVTEHYSNGGSEWYRVWSNGWIEQGGIYGLTADNTWYTKNFLKPFSNTSYGIFLQSNKTWDMGTNNNNGIIGTKTNTSFNYSKYEGGGSQTTYYMWYACGF